MAASGSTGQFRRSHRQSPRDLKSAPPSRRLSGRKIWFVGIGGAGLSGYAVLAKAWGAEVAGWDRHETPYLEYVRAAGIPVTISDEPEPPPAGYETVVSTAYMSRDLVPGHGFKSRAEFLAELVSLQDAIVVSGAHGKTTTTAMIAFVFDRLGRDPSFLIGGEIPQLGGNARAGSGWLVVEGDESDRTIELLRPEIAVVTNVDLDHHSEFASRAEVENLFARWLAEVPHVVRADELEPAALDLAVPGEHNRQNATAALAALELAGVDRDAAAPHLAEFATTLRQTLRESDTTCRIGPASFGVILEDTSEAGGVWAAERLRTALVRKGDSLLRLSAGVAAYPTHALEAHEVLARATRALEAARASGSSRVEVASSD